LKIIKYGGYAVGAILALIIANWIFKKIIAIVIVAAIVFIIGWIALKILKNRTSNGV
jgi:hypothetical protein